MADTTKGIVVPANWTYLYDLITAQRIANGQPPIQFPFACRITFLAAAAGTVFICRDPTGNPAGQEVSADDINPTVFDAGHPIPSESLRTFYVKGGGTLQVDCDY